MLFVNYFIVLVQSENELCLQTDYFTLSGLGTLVFFVFGSIHFETCLLKEKLLSEEAMFQRVSLKSHEGAPGSCFFLTWIHALSEE